MYLQNIFVYTLSNSSHNVSFTIVYALQTIDLTYNFESIKSSSSKKKYTIGNKESRIKRTTTQLTRIEEESDELGAVKNVSNASNNVSTDGDSDVFETEPIMKIDEEIKIHGV